MVADINPNGSSAPGLMHATGNTILFRADNGLTGLELFKSDGTSAGTVIVKDIYPLLFTSDPKYLTEVAGLLYFSATDGTSGYGLWRTDGTEAGTEGL